LSRIIDIHADAGALADAAAGRIAALASATAAARGRFTIALTGGTTPNAMYELLATTYRERMPWASTEFFWGDERHVPPTHQASNYRAAHLAMLGRVPLRPGQIHRIPAELPAAADAAAAYEATLRRAFALTADERPVFDLVLLGMGPDAHIASLFPGNPALGERERLVVAPWVPKMNAWRISMTLPVLNAGAAVMFLVSGPAKADAVHAVIDGPRDVERYPAQAIQPVSGGLIWMLDRAAAARLVAGKEER